MKSYSIRIVTIFVMLLLVPAICSAAKLWVGPSELNFQYQEGEEAANSTVTVTNLDMDVNGTFTWSAVPDVQWLLINDGGASHTGAGSFSVTLDENYLRSMQPGAYSGNIAVMSSIGKFFVTVTLNYMPRGDSVVLNMPTSAWLNTVIEVPAKLATQNRLYVLAEHPALLPGQMYAYRCEPATNGAESVCNFHLYSQNGHLVPEAAELYYDSDQMLDFVSDRIRIPFGVFRLAGLDGQLIIHCVVGTPTPGSVSRMYNLLTLNINIIPLRGRWAVTDDYYGTSYTYETNLFESFGKFEGLWDGMPITYFDYVNPDNALPAQPVILGSEIYIRNASVMSGYDVRFSAPNQVDGRGYEYWYQITETDDIASGSLGGLWRMRPAGTTQWSVPLSFSAVRQDSSLVIPLNRSSLHDAYITTAYVSTDSVSEYPAAMIVDTGAEVTVMDKKYMSYWLNPETANCAEGTIIGVGGNSTAIVCSNITIKLTDQLSVPDMEVWFLDEQEPGLLGMTFLRHFNVTIRNSDNAMVITK